MADIGPIKADIVRGSPIPVFDRVLVPVARLVSAHGHRGTVRAQSVEGIGWLVQSVRPLAVLEDRDGSVHALPIPDRTRTVLWQMALVALVVSLVAMVLIVANRAARPR